MLDHEGGELGVEVAEEDDVTVAHLVQDADQMAFAVGGALGGLHRTDVRDVAVVADGIVVDEVANLFYEAVVAHGDVAQGGIVDAGMLGEAFGDLDLLLKYTQAAMAIEQHTVEAIGREVLGYLYIFPILSPTAIALEHLDFLSSQLSVISHK